MSCQKDCPISYVASKFSTVTMEKNGVPFKEMMGFVVTGEDDLKQLYEFLKQRYEPAPFDTKKWAKQIIKYIEDNNICWCWATLDHATVVKVYINDEYERYGFSVCSPNDTFDQDIGLAIAACRALSLEIPEEI